MLWNIGVGVVVRTEGVFLFIAEAFCNHPPIDEAEKGVVRGTLQKGKPLSAERR